MCIRDRLDMDRFLYEDARKEFSMSKMIGFGVDGTNGAREEDFAQVLSLIHISEPTRPY